MSTLAVPELTAEDDTLAAALKYARAGWYVIPVAKGKKHPGSILGTGWHERSSRDPEVIIAWFAGADYGIALHCGRSGAVVLDVDTPAHLPEWLRVVLHEVQAPFQMTRTTDGHIGHHLFLQPPGRLLGNGTGQLGGEWGEVRGANGVIIVAPSVHEKRADGGYYQWLTTGLVPPLPDQIAVRLHDASPAEDAASDAAVAAFMASYDRGDERSLVSAWGHTFAKAVSAGESRHGKALSILTGALKEAKAGLFPAALAESVLRRAFLAAVAHDGQGKQGKGRAGKVAVSEWDGILAWAVSQALAADDSVTVTRLAEHAPGMTPEWAQPLAPPAVPAVPAPAAVPTVSLGGVFGDLALAEHPADAPAPAAALSLSPGPDLTPALALELENQRTRQQAKELLEQERWVRTFREPSWLPTLTAELALPDEAVAFRVEQIMPVSANVLLTAAYKSGKALGADELVQTPDGAVAIKDLRPGDVVLHPYDKTTTVLGVYPQGQRELFDVEFTDGVVVRCDLEHLWTVCDNAGRERTVTLRDILDRGLTYPSGRWRWHVPLANPVALEPGPALPLDPYLIGALIGDGGLTNGTPTFTSMDEHVIARVARLLPEGVTMRAVAAAGRATTYRLTAGGTVAKPNPLTDALRELGLMGVHSRAKRIPARCLQASTEERIALLRGIMDTDGDVGSRGTASVTFASEGLADDVAHLVRSLGGVARVRRRSTQWPAPDGSLNRGIAWRVTVRLVGLCPFSLPRHIERYRPGRRRGVRRSIRSVTPAGPGQAVCIKVAADDGLFLTRGFVVTHNTTLMLNFIKSLVDGQPFLGQLSAAPLTGRVTLFNYEVSRGQMRRWLRQAGIEHTDRVQVVNLRGYTVPITVPRVADWIVRTLVEAETQVWVPDPFARAFTGSNENDNTEVARWTDALDAIKERAGVTELVLPTHTGRAEQEQGRERARGATRLNDWADVQWVLVKDKDKRRFFSASGRDVDYEECALDYHEESRGYTLGNGSRSQSKEVDLRNAVWAQVMAPNYYPVSKNELCRQVGAGKAKVLAAIDALVGEGRLVVSKRGQTELIARGKPNLFGGLEDAE